MKNVDDVVKQAVKNGAKLLKPVEDMFWGDRHGVIEGLHGHKWTVATHVEDITPAKMKNCVAEFLEKLA